LPTTSNLREKWQFKLPPKNEKSKFCGGVVAFFPLASVSKYLFLYKL
jgi:hypothetical protein